MKELALIEQTESSVDHESPLQVAPEPVPDAEPPAPAPSGHILRFLKSERVLHWSIAVSFMVCWASGMILMTFFNLRSEGLSRDILSWVHRIGGACLTIFPAIALVRFWRDYRIHLANIRCACTWRMGDLKWLMLIGPSAIFRKINLPEQGKFNAAEKLNFLMVLCTYPLFVVTGLLLWLPGTPFLPWVVHVAMALIATPLMLGHIYMALVNPDTRVGLKGMVTGYVDRVWAQHHYGIWFRETFETDGDSQPAHEKKEIESPRAVHLILDFSSRTAGIPAAGSQFGTSASREVDVPN